MCNHSIEKWVTVILPALVLAVMIGCDRIIPEKVILPETYEPETYPVADLDYESACFLLADSLVFPDSMDPHIQELQAQGWALDTSYALTEVEQIVQDTLYTSLDSTEIDTIVSDTIVVEVEVLRDIMASRDLGDPMTLDSLMTPEDLSGVPELLTGADTDSHLVVAIPQGKGCLIFDNTIGTQGRLTFYFDDYVGMEIWGITDTAAGDLISQSKESIPLETIGGCKFMKSWFEYVLPPEKVLIQIQSQEQTLDLQFPMVISAGE